MLARCAGSRGVLELPLVCAPWLGGGFRLCAPPLKLSGAAAAHAPLSALSHLPHKKRARSQRRTASWRCSCTPTRTRAARCARRWRRRRPDARARQRAQDPHAHSPSVSQKKHQQEATQKFQALQRIYAVLGDEDKCVCVLFVCALCGEGWAAPPPAQHHQRLSRGACPP